MLEVVELLDGPVGGGAESIFADAAAAARAVLAKHTIADVAERENRAAGASCTTSRQSPHAASRFAYGWHDRRVNGRGARTWTCVDYGCWL